MSDVQRFNHRKLLNRIPQESGVLLLNVERFTPSELVLVEGRSRADFSRVNRLSLEAWHRAYYQTFRTTTTARGLWGKMRK